MNSSEWIPVAERLPEDETPVLVLFHSGKVRIGEIRWERPGWEETFAPFQYWDDPDDDGQGWEYGDITHWMPMPEPPHCGTRSPEGQQVRDNEMDIKP